MRKVQTQGTLCEGKMLYTYVFMKIHSEKKSVREWKRASGYGQPFLSFKLTRNISKINENI